MPIARFSSQGNVGLGKVAGDRIIDLSVALPELPHDLVSLLTLGAPALAQIAALAPSHSASLPLAEVALEAPLINPRKFLAIGMNYKAHAEEAAKAGIKTPDTQLWFNKQVTCITGPYDPIELPVVSEKLDYEGELAFVIGKRCRHVKAADARSVVAGYMICNDVSVRDWQHRSPTFTLGKSFDTHGPIGPWLTLDSEIADPHQLQLKAWVNGELRQQTSTSDMIYTIYQQIEYLSTVMTLEPGDVIATGTPAGVGIAFGKFLKVGDVVRIEVEGLGHIENTVIQESPIS